MRDKILPVIFIFSLALNLAVLVAWGAGALMNDRTDNEAVPPGCAAECDLVTRIGITAKDRQAIATAACSPPGR